jgi:hypothetical protein
MTIFKSDIHKQINVICHTDLMNFLDITLKCRFWGYVHLNLAHPMINIIRPMSVEIQSQLKKDLNNKL